MRSNADAGRACPLSFLNSDSSKLVLPRSLSATTTNEPGSYSSFAITMRTTPPFSPSAGSLSGSFASPLIAGTAHHVTPACAANPASASAIVITFFILLNHLT